MNQTNKSFKELVYLFFKLKTSEKEDIINSLNINPPNDMMFDTLLDSHKYSLTLAKNLNKLVDLEKKIDSYIK